MICECRTDLIQADYEKDWFADDDKKRCHEVRRRPRGLIPARHTRSPTLAAMALRKGVILAQEDSQAPGASVLWNRRTH
jgi:hypothetical protein